MNGSLLLLLLLTPHQFHPQASQNITIVSKLEFTASPSNRILLVNNVRSRRQHRQHGMARDDNCKINRTVQCLTDTKRQPGYLSFEASQQVRMYWIPRSLGRYFQRRDSRSEWNDTKRGDGRLWSQALSSHGDGIIIPWLPLSHSSIMLVCL